jgi:hypothetical protein
MHSPLAKSLGGQQGRPSQDGIQSYQVRVYLGIHNQPAVKQMPQTHTDSVFVAPPIDGKII